jgi:hypothetical protein
MNIDKPVMINTLVVGIIYIAAGMFLMSWGWGLHNAVLKNYNCIHCSILDHKCPPGADSEENKRCVDSEEWPFKFSLLIPCFGFILVIIPFFTLIHDYYIYFKWRKNEKIKM